MGCDRPQEATKVVQVEAQERPPLIRKSGRLGVDVGGTHLVEYAGRQPGVAGEHVVERRAGFNGEQCFHHRARAAGMEVRSQPLPARRALEGGRHPADDLPGERMPHDGVDEAGHVAGSDAARAPRESDEWLAPSRKRVVSA